MKFIRAADIHLDIPLVGLFAYLNAPEDLRHATQLAFEILIEVVLHEKLNFMVIADDLYDGEWKDFNMSLLFIRQMGLLRTKESPN